MATPTTNRICYAMVNPYSLDEYTRSNLSAAYSTRKLKSNVSKVIRVHRSSDNVEMDIGCIGENLDIATLLAFCGTDSGYVATLYDQSGNGNHATQATLANMPRIVNAGIIDRDFDATKASALYPTFASASGVNIVSNGDFPNTTGWTGVNGTLSVINNIMSITGNGSNSGVVALTDTSIDVIIGKRYYVRYTLKVTNANCVQLSIRLDGSTSGSDTTIKLVSNPIQNQSYVVDGIVTVASDFTGKIRTYASHNYADASTANGKVMEVQEVVCIDVTELGKPTMYFDGTNDVLSIANSASVDVLGAPLMLNVISITTSTTASNGYIVSRNGSSLAENQYAILSSTLNTRYEFHLEGPARQATSTGSMPLNTQKIYSSIFETGIQKGYVNGINSGVDGNYNAGLTSRSNTQIGARSNNAGGTAFSIMFGGYISEIIIATDTTKRTKLESNQMKYYQPK